MSELLPAAAAPRLIQNPGSVRKTAYDSLDHLLVVLPARPKPAHWRTVPEAARLQAAARRAGSDATLVSGRLSNRRGTAITVGRFDASRGGSFERLKFAGELAAAALAQNPGQVGVLLPGWSPAEAAGLAEALLLALHAQSFHMPAYRSKPDQRRVLKTVRLLGLDSKLDLESAEVAARAQNLARWLTALPPNRLDAAGYQGLVTSLAKQHDWQMRVFNEDKLRKVGAGAFLAVSQGNASRDAAIVHLRYRPKTRTAVAAGPTLALVGKGILFDTGGNNLKPHKSMLDMHEDMAGSAVALATLQALTETAYSGQVDCWLAVTENRISATAYKPRDVVTASNGVTIEVIHTDAEGRMVLADTLALAGREKPALMIDYATLTGACVHAVTERYSGVFTNREPLQALLVETGRECGERVWPFPMDEDFDEALKSKVADVQQCSTEGSGDHILAARFLQRFVPEKSAWIHIDLSAASRREGLGQVPGGATGFGVRLTLQLLETTGRLDAAMGRSRA